jgi:hypothetical protein
VEVDIGTEVQKKEKNTKDMAGMKDTVKRIQRRRKRGAVKISGGIYGYNKTA